MEILDIVDEMGNPTGQTVERDIAHEEGIMHRTSHVWLVRKKQGRIQVLLQKRSETKESFPGCYDISSAGHIPAGMGFVESAIKELEEELGISACDGDLIFCGDRIVIWDEFILEKEEIESVIWIDLDECIAAVENNKIKHCIYPDELKMVKDACGS